MAMYGTKLPYIPTEWDKKQLNMGLTADQVQDILDLAHAGDEWAYHNSPRDLIQVIDPATGDSLFHIAARSNNPVGNTQEIIKQYGRENRRFYQWVRHALVVHQNHNDDTALHVAARSGNLVLVTLLYRHFWNNWSVICPEDTDITGDDDPPEVFLYPSQIDDTESAPALAFLLTKNSSGNNAAEEARIAGHSQVVQWLEDIVIRLDPEGTRRLESNMAHLVEIASVEHNHAWIAKMKRDEEEASFRK